MSEVPRIAIVKLPDELQNAYSGEVFVRLGESLNCKVFVLPLNSERLIGEYATREIHGLHKMVHNALNLPEP